MSRTIVQQGGVMNIIIDTSAIIAVIMNAPSRTGIIDASTGANLVAPESIHWEIGNACSAMFKRKLISLEQAIQAIHIYEKIPIQFIKVELEAAIITAKNENIYAYDAYLIQCALQHRGPLLTLDKNLSTVAKKMGVDILQVR
jgi:predicted nucleic acid-binding protein